MKSLTKYVTQQKICISKENSTHIQWLKCCWMQENAISAPLIIFIGKHQTAFLHSYTSSSMKTHRNIKQSTTGMVTDYMV